MYTAPIWSITRAVTSYKRQVVTVYCKSTSDLGVLHHIWRCLFAIAFMMIIQLEAEEEEQIDRLRCEDGDTHHRAATQEAKRPNRSSNSRERGNMGNWSSTSHKCWQDITVSRSFHNESGLGCHVLFFPSTCSWIIYTLYTPIHTIYLTYPPLTLHTYITHTDTAHPDTNNTHTAHTNT